jgi:NAD(P) transhydrogenase
MLKLLVSTDDRTLLGVHVFGTNATDLVHIGQAIMGCGGTVDYLVDTVLNYPTLSEAYKVAALDATNKIRAVNMFASEAGAEPPPVRDEPEPPTSVDGEAATEPAGAASA